MTKVAKPTAAALLGAWQLQSWSLVYEDGRPPEFPLGEDAKGIIMYTPDGHVSATLSRAERRPVGAGSIADKAQAYDDSFAYAGRFEVQDGTVFHKIEVATNPALAGFTSRRSIDIAGDVLTLSGPDFTPDAPRYQRIVWRRAR